MLQRMSPEQVKDLLGMYYDIPRMIDEELATIQHCLEQRRIISLPSVNLSGLPGGKGVPGDRTANMAMTDESSYYDDEIESCRQRISELKEKRDWMRFALISIDRTDQIILQYAYMGPKDPEMRVRRHRFPGWKRIAELVDYSESQTRARASAILFQLSDLSVQQFIPGMVR